MLTIRNQQVLLDRDVVALYGVETKALNQAVKRNAEKFPAGYILKMTDEECSRSQIVTLNGGRGSNLKYLPYAFTEKGLYMLATVLKSTRATQATLAIIETYAKVRSMVRDMEVLQTEKAGSPEQANVLTRAANLPRIWYNTANMLTPSKIGNKREGASDETEQTYFAFDRGCGLYADFGACARAWEGRPD